MQKRETKKQKFMEKPLPSSDSDKEISDVVESTGEEEVKQIKSHIITYCPKSPKGCIAGVKKVWRSLELPEEEDHIIGK